MRRLQNLHRQNDNLFDSLSYIRTCARARAHTHIHTHAYLGYIHTYVRYKQNKHTYIHTYIHIYIHRHIHKHIHVLYTHTHTRADKVVPRSLYQSLKVEKDTIFEQVDPCSIPTWLTARYIFIFLPIFSYSHLGYIKYLVPCKSL